MNSKLTHSQYELLRRVKDAPEGCLVVRDTEILAVRRQMKALELLDMILIRHGVYELVGDTHDCWMLTMTSSGVAELNKAPPTQSTPDKPQSAEELAVEIKLIALRVMLENLIKGART